MPPCDGAGFRRSRRGVRRRDELPEAPSWRPSAASFSPGEPLRALLAAGLVLALAGCAAPTHWIYEKSGTAPATFREDLTACRMAARSTRLLDFFALIRIDRDAFKRCMERRGYDVTVVQ